MKKEKRKLVSFTLDYEIINELSIFSETSGINKSKVVEFALKDKFLKENEKNKIDFLIKKLKDYKEIKDQCSQESLDIKFVLMKYLSLSESDINNLKK